MHERGGGDGGGGDGGGEGGGGEGGGDTGGDGPGNSDGTDGGFEDLMKGLAMIKKKKSGKKKKGEEMVKEATKSEREPQFPLYDRIRKIRSQIS